MMENSETVFSHKKNSPDTSKGPSNVDSVDSVDTPPLSEEEQDALLEASGNCLVNRNFQWPWLCTPFPDSMMPPVSHQVSMIKLDPHRLYIETGEPIGITYTGRGQVDTRLPGIDPTQNRGTQSNSVCDSEFEDIDLSSEQSTPSTVY